MNWLRREFREVIYHFATLKARTVHKKYCTLRDVDVQGPGRPSHSPYLWDGRLWLWFSGLWLRVVLWVITRVSEERITFIFRVEVEVLRLSKTLVTPSAQHCVTTQKIAVRIAIFWSEFQILNWKAVGSNVVPDTCCSAYFRGVPQSLELNDTVVALIGHDNFLQSLSKLSYIIHII
jgi:hypothetical protein